MNMWKRYTQQSFLFFSSPANNQLIQLSVMRNFSFIFFICLSWKALSSGAWGTVCQHSNNPLWPYNLMSVLAGPHNPVHLCGLLMLELKLHFFCFYQDFDDKCYQRERNEIWGVYPKSQESTVIWELCELMWTAHSYSFVLYSKSYCYH